MGRNKKALLVILLLVLGAAGLVGFEGRPEWGDPTGRVWYRGELVSIGVLLDTGVVPHCYNGPDGGVICWDTDEEVAAATGWDIAGADPVAVARLRLEMVQRGWLTP
jgi:hypothetical protein